MLTFLCILFPPVCGGALSCHPAPTMRDTTDTAQMSSQLSDCCCVCGSLQYRTISDIRHANICAGIYFNVMLFPEVWRLPTLIINTDVCRTLGPLFSSAVEPKHPAPGDASFLLEVKFPNNLLHVTATSAPNSSRSWYFRFTYLLSSWWRAEGWGRQPQVVMTSMGNNLNIF